MQGLRTRLASHNLLIEGSFTTKVGQRLVTALDWCAQQPHCKGNLGISRSKMPQIATANVPAFVAWLKDKGIRSRVGNDPVGRLKATQKEINPQKVEKMMDAPDSVLMKPVMVSKDDYILDGHHRWAALLSKDPGLQIRTVRVELPIRQLLKEAHEFPESFKTNVNEAPGARPKVSAEILLMAHQVAAMHHEKMAQLRPKFASRFVEALVGTGMEREVADVLVSRTAGSLTDVSKLRFQAVFLMGAGGSGKGFAGHKWMKYMPGGGGSGYSRSQMEKKLDQGDFTEQERGLSNLNFEKAIKRLKERYGIVVDLAEGGGSGRIPFRLYDYGKGKREIPVKDWKNDLPPEVFKEVMGLTDVVFSTPKHELPNYWRQINPDIYKEELAGYKAEQPGFVHEMSSAMAKAYFEAALDTGDPLFVDGTGANLDKMEAQVKAAKKAGYKVSVVMVWVPLTVNQIRNATRSRNVDPMIVTGQWKAIKKNFSALRSQADKSKAIDNRNDSSDMGRFTSKYDFINDFIKRGTRGKYPDLYALVKKEAPGEIASYGKILLAHRDPEYQGKD